MLSILLRAPSEWQYGYDLSRHSGLKSGTLYPILLRLSERGWLEAAWKFDDESGRPRHMYRLTSEGRNRARAAQREKGVAIGVLKPHPAR